MEDAQGVLGDEMKVAERIPEIKNDNTETNDLGLNRPSPHTPWPDVHPLPNLVPIPTQNPAIAYASGLAVDGDSNIWSRLAAIIMIMFTVATKDPMNTNFHRLLAIDRVDKGVNTLDVTIPDAPMTSPLANSKVTAERPVPYIRLYKELRYC